MSAAETSGVDVVVGDFNHVPMGDRYPFATRVTGTSNAQIEWDDGEDELFVNGERIYRNTGPNDIVEVWDALLTNGRTYYFDFVNNAHCRLMLFRNPAQAPYWATRRNAGFNVTSSLFYIPNLHDRYGVAVVNEDGTAGSYSLRITSCEEFRLPLSSGIAVQAVPSLRLHSFTQTASAWSAVGVCDPYSDWDVYVADTTSATTYTLCDPGLIASSTGHSHTDFVVGDFNPGGNPLGRYFVTCNQDSGSTEGATEWDSGNDAIVVNDPPVTRTTDFTDVLKVRDVQLTAGQHYTIDFQRDGFADTKFFLFRNPGGVYWAGRGSAVLTGSSAMPYAPPSTGDYALVVVNDNRDAGSYSLGVCNGNSPTLTSGIVVMAIGPSQLYRIKQARAFWSAVGVRANAGDWDIEIHPGACNFGSALATSAAGSGQVDFVIGDFNHTRAATTLHAPTGSREAPMPRSNGTRAEIRSFPTRLP